MSNKKNGKPKRPTKAKKAKMVAVRRMGSPLDDPRVAAWDRLLRDPCAANLAAPCYGGMDSGYLVRTTDYYSPVLNGLTGLTVGNIYAMDYLMQVTPFNYSTSSGLIFAHSQTGTALPAASGTGFTNFITNSTAVKRFRPVACCVKWCPSGPYTSRQGVVSSGYFPGNEFTAGTTYTLGGARANMQRTSPNGSEMHEVRWLPTAADENFTDVVVSNQPAAGCVAFAFTGVDGTATLTTQITANGQFEITVVWEWTPASGTTGITSAPKAPLPYTSQQVLSTISDLGGYIFEGVRRAAASPGVMNAAYQVGQRWLTGGTAARYTRGPPMLQM